MFFVLKKGAGEREIKEIEEKFFKGKSVFFDAKKYNGVLKITGDALEIQKQIRNEWDRDIS